MQIINRNKAPSSQKDHTGEAPTKNRRQFDSKVTRWGAKGEQGSGWTNGHMCLQLFHSYAKMFHMRRRFWFWTKRFSFSQWPKSGFDVATFYSSGASRLSSEHEGGTSSILRAPQLFKWTSRRCYMLNLTRRLRLELHTWPRSWKTMGGGWCLMPKWKWKTNGGKLWANSVSFWQ